MKRPEPRCQMQTSNSLADQDLFKDLQKRFVTEIKYISFLTCS